MIRKILPVLTTAALAVALSACAIGRDAPRAGTSDSTFGSSAPRHDSVRDRRDGPLSPDSASVPAAGGPLASASTTQ